MGFKKGQSGNPKGRPGGIEDKRTALRGLLEPHAPKLVAKVVANALKGDTTALRICLDRLIPPMKARDSEIALGALEGPLVEQGKKVLTALGEGSLSPDQASAVIQIIGAQSRIVDSEELEKRISALENRTNGK